MFQELLDLISLPRIRSHIQALEGVRHPSAAPEALERAEAYIRQTLQSLGYETTDQPFDADGCRYSNVIATRRGTRSPEERVLVVAHYDTVATSPGADDNASGVAVLLELATILSTVHCERTLQFIGVNLEENAREDDHRSGTRGSLALARYAVEHDWSIEGVLVLESVAFAGDDVIQTAPAGLPITVPGVGNFIAVVGNEASGRLVDGFVRAVDRYRCSLPCLPITVPGTGELLPDSRRSDHAPFWDHGCRAIMITDTTNFRSPHYHRPDDTLATLNLSFAAKVCRATAGLILEIARCTGTA
jgi:Zn-dependent M28 family amino/carboxypeptidase